MKKRAFTFMVALAGVAALVLAQDQPKQPPTVVVPKGKSVSQKEAAAIKKISDAKTADERIAAVDSLVTNFPDSTFKGAALYEAAEAADSNKAYAKAVSYGDLSIEADPKAGTAMNAMLLVAGELAQHTQKYDLDREDKLGKAEKYVKEALDMLPSITKPEGVKIADADWEGFKKDKTSEAHRDLGLIATARQNWKVAATEFKLAVDGATAPDSVMMARLGNAYNENSQFAEAKAVLQKVLDFPNLDPSVKAFAASEMARADRGLKAAK
jgi:tetratricopeptide (TPR) repeat protein